MRRWHNHVCPSVNKEELTEEEDQLIMELVQQMGTKWAKIAQMLPGRTDNTIKNHWNSRMRRILRQQLKDEGGDSPVFQRPDQMPVRKRGSATTAEIATAAAVAAVSRGDLVAACPGQGRSLVCSFFRCCSSFRCCRRMRRILEFQRFLIALSVRPGSILARLTHLVPISCTSATSSWSSSSVHSSLLTEGHTWLCHLRAHARRKVLGAGHGAEGSAAVGGESIWCMLDLVHAVWCMLSGCCEGPNIAEPCSVRVLQRLIPNRTIYLSIHRGGWQWGAHRSLHCLPTLPGSSSAIAIHDCAP